MGANRTEFTGNGKALQEKHYNRARSEEVVGKGNYEHTYRLFGKRFGLPHKGSADRAVIAL